MYSDDKASAALGPVFVGLSFISNQRFSLINIRKIDTKRLGNAGLRTCFPPRVTVFTEELIA